MDDRETWVVRYAFTLPGGEGPIPVEDTEWIAKDDYVLLRSEREFNDVERFVGQYVSFRS